MDHSMCGIFGLVHYQEVDTIAWHQDFCQLAPRGPDHSSFQTFPNLIVGFHRLSIINDAFQSNQPFILEDGVRTILFICNGEIYNYKELAETHFLTVSNDCMVLPALYRKLAQTGKEHEFASLVKYQVKGEYAFVLFELDHLKQVRKVVACRDEIGIRPLYVNDSKELLFTSELKGALHYPGTLTEFPPGIMRTYHLNEFGLVRKEEVSCARLTLVRSLPDASESDHLAQIREAVLNSVRRRLSADKPLVFLLSGGVDSSLVAALGATMLGKTIRTFCCGMEEGTDLRYARLVADHIGSQHTEVFFTKEEALKSIPDVIRTVESWDTTTIRASVGQYIVSNYIGTTTDGKVVLVGEGPDEVCSSYLFNWYAPNGEELDGCAKELVQNIHYYDVKRADRCLARWGLEGRVPLLDPEFIRAYWTIPGEKRMPTYKGMEKWWLREAFAGTGLLPDAVLWRKKEAFSDGVSGKTSWFSIIQEWVEDKVTDEELEGASTIYPYCTPVTKEAYYYRKVFCELFGEHRQTVIPGYWQPKWSASGVVKEYMDPSARVLGVY